MSVESEILRIQHNIANAYAAVSQKGGEVPLQPTSANLAAAIAAIPVGSELTAGDGLSKEGDTLSVTTPVRGIVTQAEFDALTEAQKNSGLYVISDGGGGGSGGGESAGEVHSTEETRIGTWIDGKPLYRRVLTFKGTIDLNTAEWQIDTLVSITGSAHTPGSNTSPVPSSYAFLYFERDYAHLTSQFHSSYLSADIVAVFEYTKTTDEGGAT